MIKLDLSMSEDKIIEILEEKGIFGLRAQRSIGVGEFKIRIPDDVGELDFIGISHLDESLVVLECKMVKWGSTPKDYYDDRVDFLDGSKSYDSQIKNKVEWVKNNYELIFKALCSIGPSVKTKTAPTKVQYGIITYYPTPISLYLNEYPCVAFGRFFEDWDKAGKWPYPNGIVQVN